MRVRQELGPDKGGVCQESGPETGVCQELGPDKGEGICFNGGGLLNTLCIVYDRPGCHERPGWHPSVRPAGSWATGQ